jgi:hypothetical protein
MCSKPCRTGARNLDAVEVGPVPNRLIAAVRGIDPVSGSRISVVREHWRPRVKPSLLFRPLPALLAPSEAQCIVEIETPKRMDNAKGWTLGRR